MFIDIPSFPPDGPTTDQVDLSSGFQWLGLGIGAVVVIFVLFFATVTTVMVLAMRRRWTVAKQEGFDPLAADIQLMGAVKRSAYLAPNRPAPSEPQSAHPAAGTAAERLAELETLRQGGSINEQEYAKARARIVDEL